MSACPESVPNPTLDRAEALEAQLLELTAHIHAGEFRQLELIAQFDENGCFGFGVRSCAHWMNWRLGIGMGAAREKVRVARCLQKLPLIKEAFRKGKVSYSKVRAMTRVANERNQEFLLQEESQIKDLLKDCPVRYSVPYGAADQSLPEVQIPGGFEHGQ